MKTALYTWGEFEKIETISQEKLNEMRPLVKDEMLAFEIREEDKKKVFYASEDYIDAGVDGIAVKYAYAIEK